MNFIKLTNKLPKTLVAYAHPKMEAIKNNLFFFIGMLVGVIYLVKIVAHKNLFVLRSQHLLIHWK